MKRRNHSASIAFLLLAVLSFSIVRPAAAGTVPDAACDSSSNCAQAFHYLDTVMDMYHKSFDVYTDADAAGNHFIPSGWMGNDVKAIKMDTACSFNPCSGSTCLKNTFLAGNNNWAGVYWLSREDNWGTVPRGGYDLSGSVKLTFFARGEKGGERIEFFAGGVNGPYPDSLPKTSTGYITLTSQWTRYEIDLHAQNLSNVVGGFGWVTDSSENPQGCVFYLDNIQYEKNTTDNARFLVSYNTIGTGSPDKYQVNTAYTYDNALVLLAYLSRGTDDDLHRAKLIADAFIYAQKNDRFYSDNRLRNAYMGGDLKDNQTGQARIPGWWESNQGWYEDRNQVSTSTGNLAWVIIALTEYSRMEGDQAALQSAVELGDFIYARTWDDRGAGGYTGGYEGWELG